MHVQAGKTNEIRLPFHGLGYLAKSQSQTKLPWTSEELWPRCPHHAMATTANSCQDLVNQKRPACCQHAVSTRCASLRKWTTLFFSATPVEVTSTRPLTEYKWRSGADKDKLPDRDGESAAWHVLMSVYIYIYIHVLIDGMPVSMCVYAYIYIHTYSFVFAPK